MSFKTNKSKLGSPPKRSCSEKLSRKFKKKQLCGKLSLDESNEMARSLDTWVDEEEFVHVEASPNSLEVHQMITTLKGEKELLHKELTEHMKTNWSLTCALEDRDEKESEFSKVKEDLERRITDVEDQLRESFSKVKRLEEENELLKIRLDNQEQVFDDNSKRNAIKISELEDENLKLHKRIAQLEEANKMFLMVAQDVKDELWRAQEKDKSNEARQVFSALNDCIPETFGSESTSLIPLEEHDLPDDLPPPTMHSLIDYVSPLAPRWEYLGHELGVSNLTLSLKKEALPVEQKCLNLLEEWVQQGNEVSWQRLLRALASKGVRLHKVASEIHQNLSGRA